MDPDKDFSHYDNIMLPGDFNAEMQDPCFKGFCNAYNLCGLVEERAWFKNSFNSSYIYRFLTKHARSFQSTVSIETGISDLHKTVVAVLFFLRKSKIQTFLIQEL